MIALDGVGSRHTQERSIGAIAMPVLIALCLVACDQATKWAVVRSLGPSEDDHRFEIVGRALAIHYVENTGAAFGILQGRSAILALFAVFVVAALVIFFWRVPSPSRIVVVGFGMLLGGAVGNLVDRMRLGYVVDFVALATWPKFNVADAAITAGLALFAWQALRPELADAKGDGDNRSEDEGTRRAGADRPR